MGADNIGYTHMIVAVPGLFLLTGCFGIPIATDPPAAAAVPENIVTVRVCTEAAADTKDPKAREAVCLKELGKQAGRKDNVLSLKIDDGPAKIFRNDPGACRRDDAGKCVTYYLTGFYPTYATAGAYLVFEQGYEDYDFRLVNVRTGGMKRVAGVPRLAPDNSTFFVKHCNDACSISVETMTASTEIAWDRKELGDPADWDFVRWIDNDQVSLKTAKQGEHCQSGNCETVLKRSGGAWGMEHLASK